MQREKRKHSKWQSLTNCQLVVVVVLVGVSTLAAHGRHGNVIRRIFLCTVIMLCANALDLYAIITIITYLCKLNRSIM